MIILIIEQDAETAAVLERCLIRIGENPCIAHSLLEAHNLLHRYDINLILADITLFEFTAEEYKNYFCENAYPVLFCPYRTGKHRSMENIVSRWQDFNRNVFTRELSAAGCESLMIYLEACFSRLNNTPGICLAAGNIILNFEHRKAYKNGNQIFLPSRIWELLNLFRKNSGISLSIEQITEYLWGKDTPDRSACIYVYINILRKLIEPDPRKPVIILRDRKRCYRFSPGDINTYPHRQNADVQELYCGQEVLQ
ncbi:MAG: winged helix-turn-helix domain-containing protein [Spirochaetaceae bacterium]|jgi:DNA-binding response OmpR family regulator|nr:winged helix-turn-helix domain-containing protein [Spirochaetaceae bacterium]